LAEPLREAVAPVKRREPLAGAFVGEGEEEEGLERRDGRIS
jgi:hypothetical protein